MPYQGFFWQGVSYFNTVLVMGCTSSAYLCQQVTTALSHIHNSWGALSTNYLDDFIGAASPEKADKDFHKLDWLLQDIGVGIWTEGLSPIIHHGSIGHFVQYN